MSVPFKYSMSFTRTHTSVRRHRKHGSQY